MEKNSLATYKVNTEALNKYIRAQFSDYNPPPLQQFLNIKKHNYSEISAVTFEVEPRSQLPIELADLLESETILYLHIGSIELHKKEGRSWRRDIEYKQGNFFTLVNYRNMVPVQPQWFKLVFTSKAIISVLPIRTTYSYEWMKAVWLKNTILSNIFFYSDPQMEIQRKKHKFQEFVTRFKHQSFRRDTAIVHQGKKNQNIYIIGKGEAKLMKQLNVHLNGKPQNHRQVQILYLREGAIFGGELFLMSSRPVHTIINNHIDHQSSQDNNAIHQEENEEQETQQGGAKKPKKKSKSRLSKISVQQGGYELYSPHQNVSNFTVRAESANLELFYIEIDSLVNLINQRYKINFLKLLQSAFITILRRTHEKMIIQLKKSQQKIRNNHSKIESIAAKAYSAQDNKSQVVSQQHQGISMKVSQIGMMKSTLHQFKNQQVRRTKDNNMQKRSELLTKEKKLTVDFKGKIEALIDLKLNKVKEEGKNQQIIEDFTDIFMKKNQGRSEDIQKRNDLLQRKRSILQKRGGWKPGWDQLNQEGVKIQTKKTIETPNYLTGVKVQNLTAKIKGVCNHKIHQTNKIKQQFMKIKSECPSCSCYQHFENFSTTRRSMSCMGRTGFKTAQGWGRTTKIHSQQESLEKIYDKMTFLSEKTKERYNHNIHLMQVRRNRTQLQRRKSAPKFL